MEVSVRSILSPVSPTSLSAHQQTMAQISVITPTIRPDGLRVIEKCLKRQDFTDWEWIVVSPEELHKDITVSPTLLLADPPKDDGDFYCLNKAWNKAFAHAKGELCISIQDNMWFYPDMLSRFWHHHTTHPKGLFACVGNQYETTDERGEPVHVVWQDPRKRSDFGTFYEVPPSEIEFSVCALPRTAIEDAGGFDEEYDLGPAVGEKEMCLRLDRMGYKFFIDQGIEYKALKHPRMRTDWDEKYHSVITPLWLKHVKALNEGTRTLNVGFIEKYKA